MNAENNVLHETINDHEKALHWAIEYLASHKKTNVSSYRIVVETSYSIVYQIETSRGIVYLKQVPRPLFLEPDTLHFLHSMHCKNIPEVLAQNPELNCFITISCGNLSLRHRFNGEINFKMLQKGIINYTGIQRQLESKIESLLAHNIPDWRLSHFPEFYKKLLENNQLLRDDGLREEEIHQLHQLYPLCVDLSEKISQYNIPATINHCDFHENNMILDEKTGVVSIIDWGETVISHPFFSLNGCLWNLAYFYKLKETDELYRQLQSHCIAAWLSLYHETTLLKTFEVTHQLLGIYAALSYERLYQMTKNQSKTVQQEHPGSIAGCLRTFLKLSRE